MNPATPTSHATHVVIERTVGQSRGWRDNRPLFAIVTHSALGWSLAVLAIPIMAYSWLALFSEVDVSALLPMGWFPLLAFSYTAVVAIFLTRGLVSRQRQVRHVHAVRGKGLVQFAVFSDERIAVGIRGVYECAYDPAALVRVRLVPTAVEIPLSNSTVYVYRRHMTPGQLAEVKRFVRRRWGDGKDVCPACGYDLRATASEKCPECGAWIRSEGSMSAGAAEAATPGGAERSRG
jgi:hypothetical protein